MRTRTRNIEETSVLIVEDEPKLRSILVEGVRECGFRAGGVRSGEQALLTMDESPADIAILDLNLPGMDGLQCFEALKQRWPETAVIVLTGFGTLDAAKRAIQLGVVEFLTKPALLGDLEKALHRAWRALPPDEEGEQLPTRLPPDSAAPENMAARPLRDLEKDWILAALDRNEGNREATAAELGISVRKLYYRLSEYQHGEEPDQPAD